MYKGCPPTHRHPYHRTRSISPPNTHTCAETCLTTGLIILQWQPFQMLRSHAENQQSVRSCVFLQWVVLRVGATHTHTSAHKHTLDSSCFLFRFGNTGNIPLWVMLAHRRKQEWAEIRTYTLFPIIFNSLAYRWYMLWPYNRHCEVCIRHDTRTIKQGLPAKAPGSNTHLINILTMGDANNTAPVTKPIDSPKSVNSCSVCKR